MKRFNTTGVCVPTKHYMVDLSDRVEAIRSLVDAGAYFTINRARQYGKTTTLTALRKALLGKYIVLDLDFQNISQSGFATEENFVQEFAQQVLAKGEVLSLPKDVSGRLQAVADQVDPAMGMSRLFGILSAWCANAEQPIVLLIDEVDSATNNQVFLDFLSQLRAGYISRDTDGAPAFHAVILAGVTDVRHLRSKIRDEDQHRLNSPWNIATDFDVDMSLSEQGIQGMLEDYEGEHQTGMDTVAIARQIRSLTSGYPYLVSRICQIIDEKLVPAVFPDHTEAWTAFGVDEAVKRILNEKNALFDSLKENLQDAPHLQEELRRILLKQGYLKYLPDDDTQTQLETYGFISHEFCTVAIDNRIFELWLNPLAIEQ